MQICILLINPFLVILNILNNLATTYLLIVHCMLVIC
jgi:hypothetical protein